MAYKAKTIDGVVVFKLRGAFVGGETLTEVRETVRKMSANGEKKYIFDFNRVSKLNSHGLGMMLACYSQINEAGGKAGITGLKPAIENVLNITKVITLFERFPDIRSAIRALR